MLTVAKITNLLRTIKLTPNSNDVISNRQAQNIRISDNTIEIDLIVPKDLLPAAKNISTQIENEIIKINPNANIQVHIKALKASQSVNQPKPLPSVKHIIAISSCKGGVGKSTVAANLAIALNRQGHKVGLLDADIFGPSVPVLFQTPNVKIETKNNAFIPIEKEGIKLMSFGFLLGDEAAVMRGPIVTRYVQQLLLGTDWGELDYLIIDMPPGTGDVHLTITQTIRLTGALIITTPHTLSLIDVARGIVMFEKVAVPILGIVENMAYFEDSNKTRHYVFGQSNTETLTNRFGISEINEIPITENLGRTQGTFFKNAAIDSIAKTLNESVNHLKSTKSRLPEISFDDQNINLNWPQGEKWTVNNRILRLNSQDALSVDELTGKRLIDESKIPDDIKPVQILPLGNYAIGINWSDGHTAGIYPYTLISEFAQKYSA